MNLCLQSFAMATDFGELSVSEQVHERRETAEVRKLCSCQTEQNWIDSFQEEQLHFLLLQDTNCLEEQRCYLNGFEATAEQRLRETLAWYL